MTTYFPGQPWSAPPGQKADLTARRRHFRITPVRKGVCLVNTIPINHYSLKKGVTAYHCNPLIFLVGHKGLEPLTNGLRVHCSTN